MRFGMLIERGPADWQIFQQAEGRAVVRLDGRFRTHPTAVERGIPVAVPKIRAVRERDNFACVPWQTCSFRYETERREGTWSAELTLPAGGLYRIETILSTTWENDATLYKPYRGDVRFHLGVGDLFVIAGQSNAVGRAQDSAEDAPDLRVHVLRNNGEWALAAHPLNESSDVDDPYLEMSMGGTSPYLSFAKHFSALAHYPVGLIPTAQSGSPISRWDTAQSGELYRRMLRRVGEAGGQVRGMLWYQGCNDTLTPALADAYGERLRRVLDSMRRDLGEELPFFLFQINRDAYGVCDEGWGKVREAQRQLARTAPGVWALPSIWCQMYDGGHNNAISNVMLGEHLARQAASALLGGPPYEAPDLATAECTGAREVRLRFERLCGDLVLFRDEVRPCGFRVEDARGENEILHLRGCEGGLLLQTARAIEGDAFVSFCDDANPSWFQPKDPVTGLPPLAFHHVRVTCGEEQR